MSNAGKHRQCLQQNLDDRLASNYLLPQPWRLFALLLGCAAVLLAVLGIFLPLLPTVPFLLLAAACFSRSSARLQTWLFNHKYLGSYLRNYLLRKGITPQQLRRSLTSMWLAMIIAMLFVPTWPLRLLLAVIACAVTVHLLRLPRLSQ